VVEERRAQAEAIRELVEQLEEEELAKVMSEADVLGEHMVKYRLVGGYRPEKHGQTRYSIEDELEEETRWLGRLIVLNREEEVVSGIRWFREEYPDSWMEEYTMEECESLASRSLGDYGKQFVEYQGTWYEAEEIG
jgi:hypothetical protein